MAYLKLFLVVSAVAFALAEDATEPPAATEPPVEIVSSENVIQANGSFHWGYKASDGTEFHQEGEPKLIGNSTEEVVSGSFEYPGEDGPVKVSYTADETGYHPVGNVVPTVPPLIARALAYLATLPPPKEE